MWLIISVLYSIGLVQFFWASAQAVPRLGTGKCFGERTFLEMRSFWVSMDYIARRRGIQ